MDMDQLGLFASPKNNNNKNHWLHKPFFALDVETTGLNPASCRVIELSLVPFNMPDQKETFCELFSIDEPLPPQITQITNISDTMLKGKPPFSEKLKNITEIFKKAHFIVAYNAKFDKPFMESEFARCGEVIPDVPWVDPFIFICEIDRYKRGKKLIDAAKRWGVELTNAHRAEDDARAAGELMLKLAKKIDANSLDDLLKRQTLLTWEHARAKAKYQPGLAVNR